MQSNCFSVRHLGGIQPVDKNALLNESGGRKSYVDPTTGKVSSRPGANTVPVDATTWYKGKGDDSDYNSFSSPELAKQIQWEKDEMSAYFHDFELKRNKEPFWQGNIAGMGDVKITYPQNYPSQKFLIEVLDLDESFNSSLKDLICWYDNLTPAGAVIIAMRLFLKDKVGMR